MRKKINYLNNRELMHEIHESKLTFCYIEDEKYKKYHAIVSGEENVTSALFFTVWKKEKENDNEFRLSDIVIKVITYRHIPFDNSNNKKRISALNFIPFKHFALVDGTIREVVRSHWSGDLKSGYFDPMKGKITDNLARMLMKLVDRYYTRSNVRGYSYIEDMKSKSLLQLVENSLKFDERKSENPFSYLSNIIGNSMKFTLNMEKKYANLKNDLLVDTDPRFGYSHQRMAEYEVKNKQIDSYDDSNDSFNY